MGISCLMEAYIAPNPPVQVKKIASSCEICSGPHETQYCMKNLKQDFVDYASSRIDKEGGNWFNSNPSKIILASQDARLSKFEADFKRQQSEMTNKFNTFLKAINDRMTGVLPSDTVKNSKLNVNSTSSVLSALLAHAPMYNAILDKYVESFELCQNGSAFIQGEMPKKMKDPGLFTLPYMEKDPATLLLIGRGFLATTSVVLDCRKAKIAVGEGVTSLIFGVKEIDLGARPSYFSKKDFMDYHFPEEWKIARDAELNPFKNVLVFRKMVEFLGAIPINLKRNMWESKELIEERIDWNMPPKEGYGVWHIRIELIDLDGEKFNKTFQSIPTTRKLSKKENPSEIIDLDHFS
ncbi:hypothetical protein Tco_0875388 [Tanacetum coccineum]|uniref:MAK10-like protein n=1 Tax=Tanacetum coccineum TaxID=301880 RepID=A0ABQ5BS77_9ASTR